VDRLRGSFSSWEEAVLEVPDEALVVDGRLDVYRVVP
jgi:hypothetical protein